MGRQKSCVWLRSVGLWVGQAYSAFCAVGFLILNAPAGRKAGGKKLKPRASGVIIFFFFVLRIVILNYFISTRLNSLYANGRRLMTLGSETPAASSAAKLKLR